MQINKFKGIIFFVMLIICSCGQSGEEQNSVKEQVKVPTQQTTPSGDLDKFGRSPGDPHYGHNHASNEHSGQKIDSTQKPTSGEPDQFGRKPGDQHYGHNHQ